MRDYVNARDSFDDENVPDHEARGLPDPTDLPDSDDPDDYDTEEMRRLRLEALERAREKQRERDRRWEERRRQILERDRELATPVSPKRLFTAAEEVERADSDTLREQAKSWGQPIWRIVYGSVAERKQAKDALSHRLLQVRSDGTWSARETSGPSSGSTRGSCASLSTDAARPARRHPADLGLLQQPSPVRPAGLGAIYSTLRDW